MSDSFWEYDFIQIELFLDIFVFIRLSQAWQKITFHQCFIFAGDLLRCDTVDTVSIIAHSDEQRGQKDTHIKTISLLPPRHVGRTWNAPRKLIWRVEFFILNELAEPLGALFVVIEFQEAKFGGSDSGAYELVDITLVFGVEEKFSVLSNVLLELLLELDDMLEHKFFLGRVLAIGDSGRLFLFEFPTPFEFLVDDVLASLEEFKQLVIYFRLHFKNI